MPIRNRSLYLLLVSLAVALSLFLLGYISEVSAQDPYPTRCVMLVIDDFQVPFHPEIPYDGYHDQPLNYDHIKKHLDKVYPSGYEYFYLVKMANRCRAKFVSVPKKWLMVEKGE